MPDLVPNYISQIDLLGVNYTHTIQSCLTADDFLEQIKLTVDLPSSVLAPGEFPGGKTFKGFVSGRHFSIRKKGMALGKHSRELQGRVSELKQGNKTQTLVEIRFAEGPWVMIGKFLCIASLSACAALVLFALIFLSRVGELANIPNGLFFAAVIPVLGFALAYYAMRCSPHLYYRNEEEILDHVKKIAAGVVPNPDSVIG